MAKEEGIKSTELHAVKSIVMAVSAGRVNAQLEEVRTRMQG